ncbi:hypothetical protein PV326_014443, partial [Microctonus aethiopoides]
HKEAGKKIHPHTARQVISKARLGLLPNVPNFLKDLPRVIVDFPEAYKKCYFRSFFTENNKVGVVFTSLKLLEAIGHFDTTELYIDGTFNARPKKPTSAQLLVIQIRKRNMGMQEIIEETERLWDQLIEGGMVIDQYRRLRRNPKERRIQGFQEDLELPNRCSMWEFLTQIFPKGTADIKENLPDEPDESAQNVEESGLVDLQDPA